MFGIAALLVLGACSAPAPRPVERAAPPAAPAPASLPTGPAAARLAAPEPVRSWTELRVQAAKRLVAANPTLTYSGPVPDPLLAIPVLEIELNSDGSIRNIDVMRVPTQAKDTVQIAIDAVRRAAPFANVAKLPKPWKFTETFLFNDDRKFKPRTLDP
jgi:hypothetical protein